MSDLKVTYDADVRILNILTADRGVTSTSLEHDDRVVADLATGDCYSKVVALEVLSPHAYLPLGKRGYDSAADTLLFGSKEGATIVAANGPLVSYWMPDPDDPDAFHIPLGVEVLSASKWLCDVPGLNTHP